MARNLIIWAVVIIVIIGGIFLYWKYGRTPAPVTEDTTGQQQATTTPQVAGQDVTVGTGKEATPGSIVSVLYVGMLQDGTVFDSSEAHGNQPLQFQLGAQGLIPGFQIGINSMKEGGERRIAVPPELGYGNQDFKDPTTGKVIVPANSTILFDVKLIKVEAASTTPQQ